MKKTLVALAVLTVAGTSFAQVTMTGKLGFGVQRQPVNATAAAPTADSAQGLIMTDGNITFAATEDLGGGMKVTASAEIRLRGRDDNPASIQTNGLARDARVSLTTPVGLVTLGSYEAPSALLNAFAGAPVELATNADANAGGNTTVPLSARSNIDAVSLSAPVGPVVVTALYGEGNSGVAGYTQAIGQGGNPSGLAFYLLGARYTSGPITLYGDWTTYTDKVTSATTASPVIDKLYDGLDRYRVWGTYDLGVAKLGLGYQNATHSQADQWAAGVSVPMGAVTFGLTYAARDAAKASAYGAAAVERTFTGVGVKYDFSKLTNLNLSYGTHTGGANYSDEYRLRLLKNF